MRIKESDISILPFYKSRGHRLGLIECQPVVNVPRSKGAPNIQLIAEGSIPAAAFRIKRYNDDFIIKSYSSSAHEANGYTYISCVPNEPLPVGKYYMETSLGSTVVSSEDYQVLPDDEFEGKLEWDNDCDSLGYYSGGYKHEFYLVDLAFNKPETIKETVEIGGKDQLVSVKKIESFNVLGNDWLVESLSATTYNNTRLIIGTDATDISDVEISDNASDNDDQYAITISFTKSTLSKDCCDISDPFIDGEGSSDNEDPATCNGFDVSIALNNGVLSFTPVNAPATYSTIWLLNGSQLGTGSSISLGAFGTYSVRLQNGVCVATDSFTYNNPCANFNLSVNVSGATIAGNVSGDTGVTVSIISATGQVLGVGPLPFTIPESAGSGTYTVSAEGDNCSAQRAVYVDMSQPAECSHSVSINYDGTTLTGTNDCGTADNEFIEYEDDTGSVVVISNSNTHTPQNTGIYWYNAVCGGCIKRTQRLVIVESENSEDCIKVEICNPHEIGQRQDAIIKIQGTGSDTYNLDIPDWYNGDEQNMFVFRQAAVLNRVETANWSDNYSYSHDNKTITFGKDLPAGMWVNIHILQ